MQEALAEAKKGIGLTSPNPPVGAVIVKDGKIIARGWHQKAGTPHAERDALSKLKSGEAKGAKVYVTLEPCSTVGRTGSCSEALIKAEVSEVIYGARDPNPSHNGRADFLFGEAGIKVFSGICRDECEHLIRGFSKVQTTKRPWVIAKTAMSLDGRISRSPSESQWLTSSEAREMVQGIRSEVDAILTSGETVRVDNPALTLRSSIIHPKKIQPLRVVITRQGFDFAERNRYQIFSDEYKEKTLVSQDKEHFAVLERLADQNGVNTVLLECGGELMGSFLDAQCIDEFVIFLAPLVVGGPKLAVAGKGIAQLSESLSLKEIDLKKIGPDLVVRGLVDSQAHSLER